MKKSNKLILAGFSIGLFMIAAIHITLYAKYKNGDYTIYNPEDDMSPNSMQLFPNILFVTVRDIPDATVRFSDVAQVEKGQEENIEYVRNGDTLLIRGYKQLNQRDMDQSVVFNVPYHATLSLYNSSLSFRGGKTSEINPVFYLQNSHIFFSGTQLPMRFGQMKIVADSSTVTFYGNTFVNQLELQLSNSTIEHTKGNLGQLSIITDSLSRLSFQSKDFMKATIKTREQ
jgi:hypothetical protein